MYRVYIVLRHRTRCRRLLAMAVKHEKGRRWSEVGMTSPSRTARKLIGHCREMQLFLTGYFIIELCEIFTVGGFPLDGAIRRVGAPSSHISIHQLTPSTSQGFSAVHIAAVVTTCWILMLNGLVGYQVLEDGTPISLGLILFSSLLIFVGTGYIALDTGFSWTGYWNSTLDPPNKAYALYTLYQLMPIIFLVVYYLLESYLVLKVLGERRPMCMFS